MYDGKVIPWTEEDHRAAVADGWQMVDGVETWSLAGIPGSRFQSCEALTAHLYDLADRGDDRAMRALSLVDQAVLARSHWRPSGRYPVETPICRYTENGDTVYVMEVGFTGGGAVQTKHVPRATATERLQKQLGPGRLEDDGTRLVWVAERPKS